MIVKLKEIEIEFTDTEIRNYLTGKGYVISTHKLWTGQIGHTSWENDFDLALLPTSDIDRKYEYKKVFKEIILNNLKNGLLI